MHILLLLKLFKIDFYKRAVVPSHVQKKWHLKINCILRVKMKIALSGKIGSGKSWLADKLCQEHKYTKISFARRIKELAQELFDMKGKDRELLIQIGEKMRDIDPYVWIRNTLKNHKSQYPEYPENIIIDDLRFKEEHEILFQDNWILVKIDIPEEKRKEQIEQKYGNLAHTHLNQSGSHTETGLENLKFHYVLENQEKLYDDLLSICEKHDV
jgi:dephospho-CoA kinase